MNCFIYFTIVAALVGLSRAQLKQNDFTVNYKDSPNENGYNFYASDEKSFRDEKWRFGSNGPLFFIRKLGYRKPNSNQFEVVETQIDSTGTHVKNYTIDGEEKELQEPIDESGIVERTAPKINVQEKDLNLKYEPIVASGAIQSEANPEKADINSVELKPKPITFTAPIVKPVKEAIVEADITKPDKPVKPKPVKDVILDGQIDAIKPVKAPIAKPVKPKPVKDVIVDEQVDVTKPAKAPTAKPVKTKPVKPKPVKDTIVDGKPDSQKPVKDKPLAAKPDSTKAPIAKPVKPKPVKDTIVDGKPDVVKPIAHKPVKAKPDATNPIVAKPPTKKPVKAKPPKPVKPAKPVKPTKPVGPANDVTPPNQGPFPGLTFLWSLYRRPVVTVVGAFLNRPETGLNWIPFIANAPTLPPWPPKLPWERFPIVG